MVVKCQQILSLRLSESLLKLAFSLVSANMRFVSSSLRGWEGKEGQAEQSPRRGLSPGCRREGGQDRAEAGRKPGPGAGAEGSSRGSCRVCSRGARRHFRYSRPWRSALLRGSLIRQRLVPSSGAWLALPPGRATCVFPRSSTRRVRDVPLTEE